MINTTTALARIAGHRPGSILWAMLLLAILTGSCSANRVDAVLRRSITVKPFDFAAFASKKAAKDKWDGSSGARVLATVGGQIVWEDYYGRGTRHTTAPAGTCTW